MRHDQPDEPDRAGLGDDHAREERRRDEHDALDALRLDAELEGRLLAEREQVERARLRVDHRRPDRGADRDHADRAIPDDPEAPHEPVEDAAELGEVDERDHQRDHGREEEARDHPGQEERLDRAATARGGDQVDDDRRDQRPREGGDREPDRPGQRALESPEVPQHRAERGAARHAQHRGVRQRVPRQSLEGRAGDREAPARQRGEDDAREPELQHHGAGEVRARAPHQRPRRRRPDRWARDRWRARRVPRPRDPRPPRADAAATRRREITARAPGWMTRASARSASIIRGPGRWTRSPSTPSTRPSRTAATEPSRSQPRRSSASVPCP